MGINIKELQEIYENKTDFTAHEICSLVSGIDPKNTDKEYIMMQPIYKKLKLSYDFVIDYLNCILISDVFIHGERLFENEIYAKTLKYEQDRTIKFIPSVSLRELIKSLYELDCDSETTSKLSDSFYFKKSNFTEETFTADDISIWIQCNNVKSKFIFERSSDKTIELNINILDKQKQKNRNNTNVNDQSVKIIINNQTEVNNSDAITNTVSVNNSLVDKEIVKETTKETNNNDTKGISWEDFATNPKCMNHYFVMFEKIFTEDFIDYFNENNSLPKYLTTIINHIEKYGVVTNEATIFAAVIKPNKGKLPNTWKEFVTNEKFMTDKIKTLKAAYDEFWCKFDLNNPSSSVAAEKVTEFLRLKRNISDSTSEIYAKIIRPKDAPAGRIKKKKIILSE